MKSNNKTQNSTKAEVITNTQMTQALNQHYRQYLTGHLENPQPELQHIDDDIEIGISSYEKFTADTPHVHPVCTEHAYILQGSLKMRLLETKEEILLRQGDFLVLRPNTPYASKNAANTKILFIKYPATNDKTLVETDEETREWLKNWE